MIRFLVTQLSASAVEHEIHRQDLVSCHWPSQLVTVGHRYLLAFAPADLQARLGIESVNALVIDLHASLPQLQVNHTRAITTVVLRQRDDLRLEGNIAVNGGLVTE